MKGYGSNNYNQKFESHVRRGHVCMITADTACDIVSAPWELLPPESISIAQVFIAGMPAKAARRRRLLKTDWYKKDAEYACRRGISD